MIWVVKGMLPILFYILQAVTWVKNIGYICIITTIQCTGTLQNGWKGSPSKVTQAKLKSSQWVHYVGHICIGKWRNKREVLYILTKHKNIFRK